MTAGSVYLEFCRRRSCSPEHSIREHRNAAKVNVQRVGECLRHLGLRQRETQLVVSDNCRMTRYWHPRCQRRKTIPGSWVHPDRSVSNWTYGREGQVRRRIACMSRLRLRRCSRRERRTPLRIGIANRQHRVIRSHNCARLLRMFHPLRFTGLARHHRYRIGRGGPNHHVEEVIHQREPVCIVPQKWNRVAIDVRHHQFAELFRSRVGSADGRPFTIFTPSSTRSVDTGVQCVWFAIRTDQAVPVKSNPTAADTETSPLLDCLFVVVQSVRFRARS